MKLWNRDSGQLERTLEPGLDSITDVVFRGDSRPMVTSGTSGHIKVWDTHWGEVLQALEGHTKSVLGVAVDNSGTRVASCGEDTTVRVWDADTGHELMVIRNERPVFKIAFDRAGRSVIGDHGMQARIRTAEAPR